MGRPRGFWSPGGCHLSKAGVGRDLRGLSSLPVACVHEKPGGWDWQWGLIRLLKRVRHQARGAAARGRMEGLPGACGGVSVGEKHGSAPEGTRPLNLSRVALGR